MNTGTSPFLNRKTATMMSRKKIIGFRFPQYFPSMLIGILAKMYSWPLKGNECVAYSNFRSKHSISREIEWMDSTSVGPSTTAGSSE
jgi:hypothetical protein